MGHLIVGLGHLASKKCGGGGAGMLFGKPPKGSEGEALHELASCGRIVL